MNRESDNYFNGVPMRFYRPSERSGSVHVYLMIYLCVHKKIRRRVAKKN